MCVQIASYLGLPEAVLQGFLRKLREEEEAERQLVKARSHLTHTLHLSHIYGYCCYLSTWHQSPSAAKYLSEIMILSW